jgi:hypothetical protein
MEERGLGSGEWGGVGRGDYSCGVAARTRIARNVRSLEIEFGEELGEGEGEAWNNGFPV